MPRSCRVDAGGPGSQKALSGGDAKNRCSCRRTEHQTAEAIARGLRLVRVRFSLPRGELPEGLQIGDLDKWLLRLLRPGPGPDFPRVQRGYDAEGFPNLLRLGRRERWSFAASLASMKRGVVAEPCRKHPPPSAYKSWRAKCSQDPPPVDPEYLRFVRKVIRREFRFGWDERLYDSFVESFIPRNSARYELFTRSLDLWRRDRLDGLTPLLDPQFSKEDFERCLRGKSPGVETEADGSRSFFLRYKEVPAVGKVRPMGIPTTAWDLLGPLHKSIYEWISRRDWCLRGVPTPSRIAATCKGSHQTSVDLVSATDGLPIEVAETILGALLAKSTRVPGQIKVAAFDSLHPSFSRGRDVGEVTHGQMMGTYLSFPLLCLQSYCMAKWAARDQRGASFLVNGDDAVISCDRFIQAEDYPPFAELNDRKTMRARTAVEVNSTQFLWAGGRWVRVPVLRRGVGYSSPGGVRHLATACKNAGPKWQEAFAKSRLDGRILPRELGLSRRVRGVFLRERLLLRSSYLSPPPPPLEDDPHFDLLPVEPVGDEIVAFRRELWRVGRPTKPSVPDEWALYRPVYYRPRRIPLTQLTYLRSLALDALLPTPKRERLWCHAPGYCTNVRLPEVAVQDGETFLVYPPGV
nr:MAG: hypothetical protein [Botourmiaviridae sp.]